MGKNKPPYFPGDPPRTWISGKVTYNRKNSQLSGATSNLAQDNVQI